MDSAMQWALSLGLGVTAYYKMKRTLARNRAAVPHVTIEQALEAFQNHDATFIDVRPNDEFAEKHIPGAISIPLQELTEKITEIPQDQKLMLVCRTGHRSLQAAKFLISQGYTNVYNVSSGMVSWSGPTESGVTA